MNKMKIITTLFYDEQVEFFSPYLDALTFSRPMQCVSGRFSILAYGISVL